MVRIALLCIFVAHASALGRKKTNGPSVKVSATLAVDRKVVGKGDALYKKRTAQSCDAAAKIYEAELERTGYADADLLLKAADAVNTAMRIRTNSNTITIDGPVETPANKAVWKKDGQRAYDLAAKGLKASVLLMVVARVGYVGLDVLKRRVKAVEARARADQAAAAPAAAAAQKKDD